MPRLPVTVWVILAATVLGLAAPALARTEIRGLDDLLLERDLREIGAAFDRQVEASFTYSYCAQTYGITPEQQEYQKGMYARATKAFSDAFLLTYIRKTQVDPPQKVIDAVARYIENRQQQSINLLAVQFQTKRGCAKTLFRMIYKNTEKLHQRELIDAKNKQNAEKRYDPWKPEKPVPLPVITAPAQQHPVPQPAAPPAE